MGWAPTPKTCANDSRGHSGPSLHLWGHRGDVFFAHKRTAWHCPHYFSASRDTSHFPCSAGCILRPMALLAMRDAPGWSIRMHQGAAGFTQRAVAKNAVRSAMPCTQKAMLHGNAFKKPCCMEMHFHECNSRHHRCIFALRCVAMCML